MIAIFLLLACGGAVATPSTVEGCAALSAATDRENCRLELLEPVFAGGDEAAFDKAVAALEDPSSRDLVRLRIAIRDPARAHKLCLQVETDGAKEKCRQVLGRPHLRADRPEGPVPP